MSKRELRLAHAYKLKLLRQSRQLTQAELAQRLNMSQQEISAYENARADIALSKLLTLYRVLGASRNEFASLYDEETVRVS